MKVEIYRSIVYSVIRHIKRCLFLLYNFSLMHIQRDFTPKNKVEIFR